MTGARPLATVAVPASTSNLGSGFDALGLALGLYLRADVSAVVEDGRGALRCAFTGPVPPGENLIATGFTALLTAVQAQHVASLDVTISCDIPPGSGLGSSAAALVTGGRLAALVADGVTDALIIDTLTAVEGHPDNVAASVLGGLVAGCVDAHGHVLAVATPWPEQIRLVVATPAIPLLTKTARAVLPAQIARQDAIHNLQRVALLLQGLSTGRLDVLREALSDRLHQPYRQPLVPGLSDVLALDAPGVLGAFLSGAGPSVAVCVAGDPTPAIQALHRIYATIDPQVAIRVLDVHQPLATPPLVALHG